MQEFIVGLQDIRQITPEIQLLIWSCAILLAMAFIRGRKRYQMVPYYFALLGILSAGTTYVIQLLDFAHAEGAFGLTEAFNRMYSLDGLSLFFKGIFLVAGLLTVLLSRRFLEEEGVPCTEYFTLLLLSIMAMMFMAGGGDLITIYISLEFMSITIYLMVGYLRYQPRATEASLKYFVLGAFSSALLLFGMSMIYGLTGSTNLVQLHRLIMAEGVLNTPILVLAMILMFAGLGFKIAAVPFHMWSPDAYEGAPTPITAFMSVAPKAAGFAIFIRLFLDLFKSVDMLYMSIIALLSIVTMTMGNLMAVRQTNIKRLLAYSSISHAGYILMGLMVREAIGLQAIGVYLFSYLFMNIGAFAVVTFMRRRNNVGEELDEFKGLIYLNPLVAVCMLIFLLSLAGIPPTAGFIAKYWVFGAVIKHYLASGDRLFLYVAIVGALNVVVSLFYYSRIIKRIFMMGEKSETMEPLAMGLDSRVVLGLTVLGTLAIGVYPEPLIRFAAWIGTTFTGVY